MQAHILCIYNEGERKRERQTQRERGRARESEGVKVDGDQCSGVEGVGFRV